ncbi:MAG: TetR/AcrR family transcriptional regulator [Steroidobacteraceae bacterium]
MASSTSYRRSARMAERLADKRERIMRAARKLIARGGFQAAQITAVAAGAGVSTGSIYRHFPSKAALFVEVLNAAVAHEIAILEQIAHAQGSVSLRLQRAVESFAHRALEGRNLAYAFIAEPIDAEVDSERIRCRRRFSRVFARLLREGIDAGEFPAQDIEAGAACIVGAFTEALITPIAPGSRAPPARARTRLVAAISGFCLRAVGARYQA